MKHQYALPLAFPRSSGRADYAVAFDGRSLYTLNKTAQVVERYGADFSFLERFSLLHPAAQFCYDPKGYFWTVEGENPQTLYRYDKNFGRLATLALKACPRGKVTGLCYDWHARRMILSTKRRVYEIAADGTVKQVLCANAQSPFEGVLCMPPYTLVWNRQTPRQKVQIYDADWKPASWFLLPEGSRLCGGYLRCVAKGKPVLHLLLREKNAFHLCVYTLRSQKIHGVEPIKATDKSSAEEFLETLIWANENLLQKPQNLKLLLQFLQLQHGSGEVLPFLELLQNLDAKTLQALLLELSQRE